MLACWTQVASLIVTFGVLGLVGCGGTLDASIPDDAPPETSVQTFTSDPKPEKPPALRQAARRQDRGGRTSLLGEPLFDRITDAPKPTETDLTPQLKYVLIFRLSRDAYERDFERKGNDTKLGRYSVLGDFFNDESEISHIGPRSDHCFAGYYDSEYVNPLLERIEIGGPVDVTLRPLDRIQGQIRLGRLYEKSPPMRTTSFDISTGTTRDQLRTLGCRTRALR